MTKTCSNTAVGLAGDDPLVLRNLALYLEVIE